MSRNTVANVVQMYEIAGTVKNTARPGCSNIFSKRTMRCIRQIVEANLLRSAEGIAVEILGTLNVTEELRESATFSTTTV